MLDQQCEFLAVVFEKVFWRRFVLLVEIEKKDLSEFVALTADRSLGVEIVETDNLDASGVEVIKLLVPVTTAAITAAAAIIVQMLRSRRHVKIKQGGVEITGLNADNAIKVLSALSETK